MWDVERRKCFFERLREGQVMRFPVVPQPFSVRREEFCPAVTTAAASTTTTSTTTTTTTENEETSTEAQDVSTTTTEEAYGTERNLSDLILFNELFLSTQY